MGCTAAIKKTVDSRTISAGSDKPAVQVAGKMQTPCCITAVWSSLLMIVWRFSEGREQKSEISSVLCFLFSVIFLCNSYLLAKPAPPPVFRQEYAGETPQYKIFTLTNISADEGAKFLAEVKIGTVSKFPGGSNALLITAEPSELTKATSILTLVDAKELFCVRMITPAAGLDNLPSNEQIASKVGNMSVGTFLNPPASAFRQEDAGAARAIVDIHDNALVVVSPASQIERIISVIEGRPIPPAPKSEAGKKAIEQPTVPRTVDYGEPTGSSQLPIEQTVIEPRQPSEAIFPATPLTDDETAEASAEMSERAERYAPTPIRDGDETLKLNLPERLEIIDLLGLAGEYLGLDFMYDPGQIVGIVTLKLHGKLRGDLRVKDLYPLLESALKFRGFAMTRKGNLVTITPVDQALDNDPVLITDETGEVEQGDVIVTRVFQLQHINTASAQNLLTSLRLITTITPIVETGTIIVTGYAYRMPRIEELLDIIDRPGEPKEFRFRQLKFTMAPTLASKVKTLSEQLGTVSITITTPTQPIPTRGRQPRRPTRPTPTPTPTPTKPTVYLDADERTNRILMIGQAEQLDTVDALIDTLDVVQQDLRTMKLYKIEHVDAEEARNKLGELGILGGGKTRGTSSRITAPTRGPTTPGARPPTSGQVAETAEGLVEEPQVVVIEMTNSLLVNATPEQHTQIQQILAYVDSRTEEEEIPYKVYPLENQKPEDLATVLNQLIQETVKDREGKIQEVVRKTEEEITIIPDENTFSIIVYASKKSQEWIKSLIEQLDKRRPQVLIDVTLVEISEADAFDYDLQLVSKYSQLMPGGQMDFLSAFIGNPATDKTPDTFFPDKRIMEATSILGDGGAALGFYADNHIQALLSLMQKKGYGRVLAKPKILVNDNEQGHIDTMNTIYVARSSESAIGSGTSGTTISTSVSFDQFPSGINLDITPHISEGSLLRLEIQMTRSSQPAPEGGISANEPPPNKSENNIYTIVTVPDKSTIILGGITTLEQSKNNWKVPLLGDVPLVGGLFRKINNSSRQTKLYVFVKADILRPAKNNEGLPDLERISEKNRLAFEKFEEKFQKYEDWPGIKSKPMDPLKVLEAE